MTAQFLGKTAIGAAAFGAAAAVVLVLAATDAPTLEARLGVLGVEMSVSIGNAPTAAGPAYLEASMLRRSPDNRLSGVDLRIAKADDRPAPALMASEQPISRVSAAAPAETAPPSCPT